MMNMLQLPLYNYFLKRRESHTSTASHSVMDDRTINLEKVIKDYKADIGERLFEHQFKAFKTMVANPDKSRLD